MAKAAVQTKDVAKTASPVETHSRGKKGDGPVVISFLDENGNESKRVSDKSQAIRIADKNGNTVELSVNDLSPATRNQLIILGAVRRVDTFVRNGAKQDGANVISLATGVINSLKNNVIYSRKEGTGTGAGRPFDFAFYRLVMAATAKSKGHEASEKQLEAWETKLKARTPADRKAYIAKLRTDPSFNVSFKKADAARLAAQVKGGTKSSDVDALEDLF